MLEEELSVAEDAPTQGSQEAAVGKRVKNNLLALRNPTLTNTKMVK